MTGMETIADDRFQEMQEEKKDRNRPPTYRIVKPPWMTNYHANFLKNTFDKAHRFVHCNTRECINGQPSKNDTHDLYKTKRIRTQIMKNHKKAYVKFDRKIDHAVTKLPIPLPIVPHAGKFFKPAIHPLPEEGETTPHPDETTPWYKAQWSIVEADEEDDGSLMYALNL